MILVVMMHVIAALRLLFAVAYPEREIKEIISEFFKNNLDKSVKFEDVYIDFSADIIITDFNVSITSDFNDNISLIKSKKGVIHLSFFDLVKGQVTLKGIDFNRNEVTFPKKYGRGYLESIDAVIDLKKFIQKMKRSHGEFFINFNDTSFLFRETLRDRQVLIELFNMDSGVRIGADGISYDCKGNIRPLKTQVIRKGSFHCTGSVRQGSEPRYDHRIIIENFDLSYLNDYIGEFKWAEISLSGGWSTDVEISRRGDLLAFKGDVETNSLAVADITRKFNLVANENLTVKFDVNCDLKKNIYIVKSAKIYDEVFTITGSGEYADNKDQEKVAFQYNTNKIDLADLSQNLTPVRGLEYSGILESQGTFILDKKKNTATGSRINISARELSIRNTRRGQERTILGESDIIIALSDTSLNADMKLKPLGSDLAVTGRTQIASWAPLKSESRFFLKSRKMNGENIFHALRYSLERLMAGAYESRKKSEDGGANFLQKPAGRFMNNNNMIIDCDFKSIFFGKKTSLSDFILGARLNRGVLSLNEFKLDGCDAKYKLAIQGYFNSDMPYVKLEGKIDDFNIHDLYSGSGLRGSMTGMANVDFSYELSAYRLADILENSKGRLNVFVGKGEMKKTAFQDRLTGFLKKNGYQANQLSSLDFDSMNISISQQGENFWIGNMGIKGDKLYFTALGDFIYNAGLQSKFVVTLRDQGTPVAVPLVLSGPLLAPCLDIFERKGSVKACF